MPLTDRDADSWEEFQKAGRSCVTCIALEGVLFAPFLGAFPRLPRPEPQSILFISEAPPREGGFWSVAPQSTREDDLREKLLPLLGLRPEGPDRGLSRFVAARFFLLQAFPRPLKFSAAGLALSDLWEMLEHPVAAHLGPQIQRIAPRAIVTLGRVAAAAVSAVFLATEFATAFRSGDIENVHGRTFATANSPRIGATYLPSGGGRFFRDHWTQEIPDLVAAFGAL
jgi:hypothetical protein